MSYIQYLGCFCDALCKKSIRSLCFGTNLLTGFTKFKEILKVLMNFISNQICQRVLKAEKMLLISLYFLLRLKPSLVHESFLV